MTYGRFVFAFALLMLLAGVGVSRWLMTPLFQTPSDPRLDLAAAAPTAAPTWTPLPTRVPAPSPHHRGRIHAAPKPTLTPTPLPTSTPRPTPSPTAGTVTLARYWVGSLQAHRGETIALGYVIDNQTGRTARTLLGASLKPSRLLSWVGGTVSDPRHDVVAIVPPGVSTHLRYFTLPAALRPGKYDVAWGLRDAATARRDALVTASAVLRVVG